MPRAYHPTLRDVSVEITDAEKEAHKAAGWRLTPIPAEADEPKAPTKKPKKG